MKVYIDPAANIVYASYYIDGLKKKFGSSRVGFSSKYFRDLPKKSMKEDFDHYFAFVVKDGKKVRRIAIDFRDKTHLNKTALDWCDVYGKVNYKEAEIEREGLTEMERRKIVLVGTNFGVQLWNKPMTAIQFLLNYARCGFKPGVSRSAFFRSYVWQMNRATMGEYGGGETKEGYIYFISTLWKNDKDSDLLNGLRASYIRICKSLPLKFEGGLFTTTVAKAGEYADIVTDQYINHHGFVENIAKSMTVFNTPAVWNCHGWKLGEFLAMGKAIISTPFQNEMPVPLVHGRDIHFVSNETELRDAILRLSSDKLYRDGLERGAASYHQQYLQPEVVITRLLNQK